MQWVPPAFPGFVPVPPSYPMPPPPHYGHVAPYGYGHVPQPQWVNMAPAGWPLPPVYPPAVYPPLPPADDRHEAAEATGEWHGQWQWQWQWRGCV